MADKKFISLSLLASYDEKIKKFVNDLLDAANGDITVVKGLVDTLIGTDSGKSVRTIANEELVKQLIPENAKEALDTLQEIAAWIQAHPDDAADMNARIAVLEGYVGTPATEEAEATGLFKTVADNHDAAKKYTDDEVKKLSDTVVSATSTEGEAIVVTLGGKVGAPTVAVSYAFAEEADIAALFETEEAPEENA